MVDTPGSDSPLVTLGLNLSRSMKYLHVNQGVSRLDLIWVLHGMIGQVLSWEELKEIDPGEYPRDGRSYGPTDLDP